MMRFVTPIVFPLVGIVSFAFFGPLATICAKITGSGKVAHRLAQIWSRLVLSLSGIHVRTVGRDNCPVDRPVIFACNHASQVDILVLYQALPVEFRFVVKEELFKIPVLGFSMRAAGYIPIHRSGGKKAVKSLIEAAKKIRKGASIVIFPEGTRSRDGRLQEFKTGAFMLALKSGCPIVPVAIRGTHDILPKGSLVARPGEVEVIIGRPIEISTKGRKLTREEAARLTHDQVAAMLAGRLPTGEAEPEQIAK